jgi:hypothetical protein
MDNVAPLKPLFQEFHPTPRINKKGNVRQTLTLRRIRETTVTMEKQ